MFDYKKYLRYKKINFETMSHKELVMVAYEFMEAYKSLSYRKLVYKNNMEKNIAVLGDNIENLSMKIDNNCEYEKKYKTLINRKLTIKERIRGIIEIDK